MRKRFEERLAAPTREAEEWKLHEEMTSALKELPTEVLEYKTIDQMQEALKVLYYWQSKQRSRRRKLLQEGKDYTSEGQQEEIDRLQRELNERGEFISLIKNKLHGLKTDAHKARQRERLEQVLPEVEVKNRDIDRFHSIESIDDEILVSQHWQREDQSLKKQLRRELSRIEKSDHINIDQQSDLVSRINLVQQEVSDRSDYIQRLQEKKEQLKNAA